MYISNIDRKKGLSKTKLRKFIYYMKKNGFTNVQDFFFISEGYGAWTNIWITPDISEDNVRLLLFN